MSGLRALATRMGELDGGLGGIVLMSEGFDRRAARARAAAARSAGTRARRQPFSRAALCLRSGDAARHSLRVADGDADVESSSAVLQGLARQTGGDGLPAGQDLGPAFQRVSRDLDSHSCPDVHVDDPDRWPFSRPADHVEPARCAGSCAIRLLGAASERTARGDAADDDTAPSDASASTQPAYRVLVRFDR